MQKTDCGVKICHKKFCIADGGRELSHVSNAKPNIFYQTPLSTPKMFFFSCLYRLYYIAEKENDLFVADFSEIMIRVEWTLVPVRLIVKRVLFSVGTINITHFENTKPFSMYSNGSGKTYICWLMELAATNHALSLAFIEKKPCTHFFQKITFATCANTNIAFV